MYSVKKLNEVKQSCLVTDIETSSFYPDGKEINIGNFDDYLEHAECKFIGMYSYRDERYYFLNMSVPEDYKIAVSLLATHSIIVGFNSEEFDYPILKNNEITHVDESGRAMWYTHVDCMQILGTSVFKNKKGYSYKDRGSLMKYKFKNNKLRTIAEAMGLKTQKGEIDYAIFQQNSWTDAELEEINIYLKGDVMSTKEMFDILWSYWLPFVEMLDEKSVYNLSWIRSSIASLTYKCACNAMGVEPTYSDYRGEKEEMGGRVIKPKYEEARKVWYVDFASLYPHIFCMFNLFAEADPEEVDGLWHGNHVFKTKGHYDVSDKHTLTRSVEEKLVERIALKKNEPENPMIYTIKIFLNGLYGVARSAIFDQVGGENCGWDCCWLGQQIQELTEQMMDDFGFETIAGDTDSIFVVARDEENNNREYVKECLVQIIEIINDNVPFPIKTFNIDIEHYIDYILFPFSMQSISFKNIGLTINQVLTNTIEESVWLTLDKYYKQMSRPQILEILEKIVDKSIDKPEKKINLKLKNRLIQEYTSKKKNYLYLYKGKDKETDELKDKIELVGLPIKKDNATKLGIELYEKVLKPIIIETKNAKFPKEKIDKIINIYLAKPEVMNLISREYKVKPHHTYAKENQIQGQISKHYFDGEDGVIDLIKNNKIGKVGQTAKYCTVQEAVDAKLTTEDLDLEKLYNELDPFTVFVPKVKKPKKEPKKKATKKKKEEKVAKSK